MISQHFSCFRREEKKGEMESGCEKIVMQRSLMHKGTAAVCIHFYRLNDMIKRRIISYTTLFKISYYTFYERESPKCDSESNPIFAFVSLS